MALLDWFVCNYDINKIKVLNIEHGIRGVESLADSMFVSEYCREINIDCICRCVNAGLYAEMNSLTLEEAARVLRRNVYSDVLQMYPNSVVATAHHASDQTETVLMNIFRGSGIGGLRGMSVVADEGIIHPMLYTDKADIMRYIEQRGVPYRTDSSNEDTQYTRNYVRNVITPMVKERFPALDRMIAKLSEHAREVMEYINEVLPPIIEDNGGILIEFADCPKIIFAEQVRRACRELGVFADIESRHIELLRNMADSQRNSAKLNLPYGLIAYKEYRYISIARSVDSDDKCYSINNLLAGIDLAGNNITACSGQYGEYGTFALNKLPQDSVVRVRRSGDYMKLSGGTKSLGDIMTDKKIPMRLRDILPVIAIDGEVLVLADIIAAPRVQAKDNLSKIVVKSIKL